MSGKEIVLHLHHANNTKDMLKLTTTLQELTEKERRSLILKLCKELNIHQSTVYRWAKGETKPIHPLIEQRLDQLLDEFKNNQSIIN